MSSNAWLCIEPFFLAILLLKFAMPRSFRSFPPYVLDLIVKSLFEIFQVADPRISCTHEMLPFYLPGAVLLCICAILGMPYLFYKLVRLSFKLLSILPINTEKSKAQQYLTKIGLSENSCCSLYNSFEHRW